VPKYLDEPTDDAMDRIYNMNWHRETSKDGVVILDLQKHDAINVTVSGTVEIDGLVHGFIIDDGDRGGTEIRAFGDPDVVGVAEEPERPEPATFVPVKNNLYLYPKFAVYLHWRQESEFNDKIRGLAYDSYFAPGLVTDNHYQDYAARRSMKIGYLSNFPPEIVGIIQDSDAKRITVATAMERIFAIYPQEETARLDQIAKEMARVFSGED